MNHKNARLGKGVEEIVSERGLDFLLPKAGPAGGAGGEGRPLTVSIDLIDPNPYQPRLRFDDQKTASLAQSIKSEGVVDPLLVGLKAEGRYELIDGERRLRAARLAGLEKIPVIIREASDDPAERLRLALVHNLCRADLNPMEEAEAFARLEMEFAYTHQEIAEIIGRERSTVTNSVRLLKLPDNIQDDIRYDRLTPGHGRALLGLSDQDLLNGLREEIIVRKLSVRQLEVLIKRLNRKKFPSRHADGDKAYYEELAASFSSRLRGLKVKIDAGKVEIFYTRPEELEWLIHHGLAPTHDKEVNN